MAHFRLLMKGALMFLPNDAVVVLCDFLEDYLLCCLDEESLEHEGIDPNDYIIFHEFILPELKEAKQQGQGIETEQLFAKGWALTVGLLPCLLQQERLQAKTYGVLMRAFQTNMLHYALHYISCVDDEYYQENQANIDRHIRFALVAERKKYQS